MLELNKENFEEEVLNAEGLVLVDFWGDSCEPCKELMPDIEALSEKYGDEIKFSKLNTSKARRLAISQRVLGLPTIILYRNGEKIEEVNRDNANKEYIEEAIKKHI
ncbi:MAG TPA: thiol reductase thioredoxin [Clostridiales bacterium]|nr:thiol reductase thioredoxin [Clostridiales bacterium]